MFPGEFEYYRPDNITQAISLLSDHDSAEVLAGGYSLIPSMKTGSAPSKQTGIDPSKKTSLASPDALVDLNNIDELRGIETNNGIIAIGAMTRYISMANNDILSKRAKVIHEAAKNVGTTQIRNRGTIGGNIAYADPASDLPGAALTADATIVVRGTKGERKISMDDFLLGDCETSIRENEIITEIQIPQREENVNSAYKRRTSPSSGYAVVGVGASIHTEDKVIKSARIAANGLTNRAVRINSTENSLTGVSITDGESIEAAAEVSADAVDEENILEDINASATYRQNLLPMYVEDAITAAIERAN